LGVGYTPGGSTTENAGSSLDSLRSHVTDAISVYESAYSAAEAAGWTDGTLDDAAKSAQSALDQAETALFDAEDLSEAGRVTVSYFETHSRYLPNPVYSISDTHPTRRTYVRNPDDASGNIDHVLTVVGDNAVSEHHLYKFEVTESQLCDILIIGAGGGGSHGIGGGGGAGTLFYEADTILPAGNYSISVREGGAGGTSASPDGGYGQHTNFSKIQFDEDGAHFNIGVIACWGGQGGGTNSVGYNKSSGGGGDGVGTSSNSAGAVGLTHTVNGDMFDIRYTTIKANSGANGDTSSTIHWGGGGGGAGAAGSVGMESGGKGVAGHGGVGWNIHGETYCSGGNGGNQFDASIQTTGYGSGGSGGSWASPNGHDSDGQQGHPGIVKIFFKGAATERPRP